MNEIIFMIEDDLDGGLNARALGHSIFTEAETIDELKQNIIDALNCHFEKKTDVPRIIRLHYVREEILNYA